MTLINGIVAGLLPHIAEHTVDFKENGEKLVHQIDSEHQNYKFTILNSPLPTVYPAATVGFREYGLPAPERGTEELPFQIVPHGGEAILPPEIPVAKQPIESLSLPALNGEDVQSPIIVPSTVVQTLPAIPTVTVQQGPISGPITVPENTLVNVIDNDNQYTHGFSLNDGTKVAEQGHLITTNGGWEYVLAKQGSYEYVSPEGKEIKVNWIADDKGFRHV